ncbi:MAG: amphi-Trp domain-containing protein [Halobacterium sp.]
MPEEVLFESEVRQRRTEVADYLRTVAEKLEAGGSLTLSAGDQSVTLDPRETVDFEVKAEEETEAGSPPERSVEFELEWREGKGEPAGDLDIS